MTFSPCSLRLAAQAKLEWVQDQMAVTLKDVAERAGVSRAAVSRTFTEGASVSAKTRAKVEAAATALGYSPNMLARSLTTRKTQLIGLVSNNFHNPVFLQIFDLFTRALQEQGLRPLLVNLSDETDPARSVQLLRQYSVDGVIVASSHLPSGFARAFRRCGGAGGACLWPRYRARPMCMWWRSTTSVPGGWRRRH